MGADGELEEFEFDHEPLVRRLRDMEWPALPPDVRERAWREFQRRIKRPESYHGEDDRSAEG